MSNFNCALSGVPAEVPVVSPRSGEIFERRLLVKFIEENGTDPINNQTLSVSELVEIKVDPSIRPTHRNVSSASVPALLKTLQDEWDATMLNSFTLRQDLKTAREELTHALYQNDAACRVINRLSGELQSARQILATLPHGRGATMAADVEMTDPAVGNAGDGEDGEEPTGALPGISEAIMRVLKSKGQELTATRKQRSKHVPEGLVHVDEMRDFLQLARHDGIHSASTPGITAMDLQKNLVLTGGVDKCVVLFNMESETIENTFKGHQKRISSVVLHPDQEIFISGAHDSKVRIWKKSEEAAKHVISLHDKAITDISLHPNGDYIICSSDDSNWSFHDINAGRSLTKIHDEDDAGICAIQFHPDGMIFGTGAKDSVVKIWDLTEQNSVAKFPGHTGHVRAISFSENGYYLATGADDGEVMIWDLRKLKNFKTLSVSDGKINALSFDQSGQYLAIAGDNLQVIRVKTWSIVSRFDNPTPKHPVSGVRFGENAKSLVFSAQDLNVYGASQ